MMMMEENWLRGSIEFRLIRDLCQQCCNHLAPPTLWKAKGTSRRQNKEISLSIELRKALRRPSDLDLLLGLDPIEDEDDIREAHEVLEQLCAAINNLLKPTQDLAPALQPGYESKYERFEDLLLRLNSSDTEQQIEVISGPNPTSFRRLFVSPLADCKDSAVEALQRLNQILDYFSEPSNSMSNQAAAAVMEPIHTQTESPLQPPQQRPVRKGIQNFFRHGEAAVKAIFSKLSRCEHRATKAHDILIQLPTVEVIKSPSNRSRDLELELFLSVCTGSSDWQEAQVIRQSSKCVSSDSSICNAVQEALDLGASLDFHIQDQLTDIIENDFQIPWVGSRDCNKLKPKPSKTLRKLLCSQYLRRCSSLSSFKNSANVQLIGASERKVLAIQIIFGLVMCLRYSCTAATWDFQKVFVLADEDENQHLVAFPHVMFVEGDPKTVWFNLPDLKKGLGRGSAPKAFKEMAKALLEIGNGECLDDFSEDDIWKTVQNITNGRHTKPIDILDLLPYAAAAQSCLRFSLLYRTEFTRMSMNGESIDPWTIVEDIVYKQIIGKLNEKGVIDAPVGGVESVLEARGQVKTPSATGIQTKFHVDVAQNAVINTQHAQRNVVRLFDGSRISSGHGQAERFFKEFDSFRVKFERHLKKEVNSLTPPRPVRIAILDTGVDKSNAEIDFDGKHMKKKWCINFVRDPLNPSVPPHTDPFHDHDGHGTHCASLLRKVAPDAEIYVAKVFDKNEFDLTQAGNISEAIKHCVETWEVDIISMSFGLEPPESVASMDEWRRIKKKIEDQIAMARTTMFFAAASNDGRNKSRAFPSTNRNVFCIHASDGNGNSCGINPRGDRDNDNFMTLGTGIRFLENDDFVFKEGTSFATAIAAGMAASVMHLCSRTRKLEERSRAALRTREGMQKLLRKMAGPDKEALCPYVAPWRYWDFKYWDVNPHGLDKIWSELNSEFNDFSLST